jgi:hypothetical protein
MQSRYGNIARMKHEEVVQMRFMSNFIKKYKRATPKQLVLTGVFMLAFAGAIGAGFASQQPTSAATGRDTNRENSIMNVGSIGCLSVDECHGDIVANQPGDLQALYKYHGLDSSEYGRFKSTAKIGQVYKDGRIMVDGEVVANDAWSTGRTTWVNTNRWPYKVPGSNNTYYKSPTTVSFGSGYLDAVVMFTEDGSELEFAILTACGNPTWGTNIKSTVKCDGLEKHKVGKNLYRFSSKKPITTGGATIKAYKYYVDGKLVDTTTKYDTKTKEIALKKTSTVHVEIEYTLPGTRNIVRKTTSEKCKEVIKYEEEKFEFACEELYATSKDNMTFRFNLKASHSSNVKLVSADFILDGNTVTEGVKAKNEKGEIYKEYTFKDDKTHTVAVRANFEYTKDGQTKKVKTEVTKQCTEQVKPKQPPVCKHNPKLPPEDPKCKPPVKECKPGIPEGDERCETCEDNPGKEGCELPETGVAGVAGLFAGVTAFGAIGHRVFTKYRTRR